jgi:hypothetical protein
MLAAESEAFLMVQNIIKSVAKMFPSLTIPHLKHSRFFVKFVTVY